jgi:hypothetical protein
MKNSAKKNPKQSKSGAKLKTAPDEKMIATPAVKLNLFSERIRQRTEISRKAALSKVIEQIS